MPRKMSPERTLEFEELSLFLEYYSTFVSGIDRGSDMHPSNVLLRIVEKSGKSKALQGLKQAINDTIEETQYYGLDSVSKLDSALSSRGIVTLSELRKRYWSKFQKILKSERIKNETEYYLIAGILNDVSRGISGEERNRLSKLVRKFENRA